LDGVGPTGQVFMDGEEYEIREIAGTIYQIFLMDMEKRDGKYAVMHLILLRIAIIGH